MVVRLFRHHRLLLILALILLVVAVAWPRDVFRSAPIDPDLCVTCGAPYLSSSKSYGAPYGWFEHDTIAEYARLDDNASDNKADGVMLLANLVCWLIVVGGLYLLIKLITRNRHARPWY